MPSKKKKYNARFPPARIKKIMQMDDEVGKVAAPVPVIISRALELFIEALIDKSRELMQSRNTRTLTAGHMKHVIVSEKKYSFLAELVRNVADVPVNDPEDAVKPTVHRQQQSNIPNEMARTSGSATGERRPRGRPKKQATGDVQTGSEVKTPGKRRRQKIADSEKPPKRRRKKKELEAVDVDIDADPKECQEDSLPEAGVTVSHDSSGENSNSTLDCNEDSISDDKEGDVGVSDAVTTVAVHNGLHQSNKLTVEQIERDCMPTSSLKPVSVTVGNAEHVAVIQKFPTELPRHMNDMLHGSQLAAANFQPSLQPHFQHAVSTLNIATPSVDKSQAYLATHRMPPVLPSPRPLTSPPILPLTVYAHCDARNNNSLSPPGLGQSNTSK